MLDDGAACPYAATGRSKRRIENAPAGSRKAAATFHVDELCDLGHRRRSWRRNLDRGPSLSSVTLERPEMLTYLQR
jgi:hypothetical protein